MTIPPVCLGRRSGPARGGGGRREGGPGGKGGGGEGGREGEGEGNGDCALLEHVEGLVCSLLQVLSPFQSAAWRGCLGGKGGMCKGIGEEDGGGF